MSVSPINQIQIIQTKSPNRLVNIDSLISSTNQEISNLEQQISNHQAGQSIIKDMITNNTDTINITRELINNKERTISAVKGQIDNNNDIITYTKELIGNNNKLIESGDKKIGLLEQIVANSNRLIGVHKDQRGLLQESRDLTKESRDLLQGSIDLHKKAAECIEKMLAIMMKNPAKYGGLDKAQIQNLPEVIEVKADMVKNIVEVKSKQYPKQGDAVLAETAKKVVDVSFRELNTENLSSVREMVLFFKNNVDMTFTTRFSFEEDGYGMLPFKKYFTAQNIFFNFSISRVDDKV
jgi:chromosome segregation ATPase